MADAAYTMLDFEQRADTTLKKAVIRTWRQKAPIMERLKWKQQSQFEIPMVRTKQLPTANWVKLGEALPQMKGQTEPYKERVYKMGGKIDMPREYPKAKSIVDERATQEQMAVEAMAYNFNDAFINGNPDTDEDSLIGLHWRFNNMISSAQIVDGGALDISPDTAATNWWFTILDLLDALRDTLEGDDCDAFLCDIVTKERLESAFRRSGLLSFTKDQVGRRFMTLGEGGPLVIPMGVKGDQATKIIDHTELANGTALTGGAATSIYAIKFGEPYLAGFYFSDIRTEDKGELEDGVNVRTVVDWLPGIYHVHPRGLSRLINLVAK